VKEATVDKKSLAHTGSGSTVPEHEERRNCFYCLEGWVFLGSLDHDGEEIIETVRSRRCKGTGFLPRAAAD
jgi:hypothetical protein